jgi:serine/threonine protein phosphatase 1
MPARVIAIGDIHGCSTALAALLAAVDPTPDDTIVTLGDYVDRGPDSKGVLEQIIDLAGRCRLVPLLGNHEEMLLNARDDEESLEFWLDCGGAATIESYGCERQLDRIPLEHIRFIEECLPYYEIATHFFVHANYEPDRPLAEQDEYTSFWLSLRNVVPPPHESGKIAIVGHTPQADAEVLDLGHLKCIDTGCVYGGWLTALEVVSGQTWQADRYGALRKNRSQPG